jgi:hypothetical protein
VIARLAAFIAIALVISPFANAADPPDTVLIGTYVYEWIQNSGITCSVPPTNGNGPQGTFVFHRSGTGNVTMTVPLIIDEQFLGGESSKILQMISGMITLIFSSPTSGSIEQLLSPNNSGEPGSDFWEYTPFFGYTQFYNPQTQILYVQFTIQLPGCNLPFFGVYQG